MRASVDVEDQRIFLRGIEIRRFLNPGLNALAIEAGVVQFFWFFEIEL